MNTITVFNHVAKVFVTDVLPMNQTLLINRMHLFKQKKRR